MSRVLVIDDNHAICWCFVRLGNQMGHEVHTASSAEQGLQEFASFRPGLVILDLHLPGIDGIEALKKLKEQEPTCPVVLISAYWCTSTLLSAKFHGANKFLSKPFTLSDAIEAIAHNLESRPTESRQILQ